MIRSAHSSSRSAPPRFAASALAVYAYFQSAVHSDTSIYKKTILNGRRAALAIFSGMNILIYQWENLRIFPLIFSQGESKGKVLLFDAVL